MATTRRGPEMHTSIILLPLTRRVLVERWRGLVGWVSGIVLLIAIQVSVYPTIRDSRKGWSDLTEQFPEAFRKIFRMEDYTSPSGYLSTELFSFMIPLIFIGLTTTWAARSASEEEENGTADILMSLPVSRTSILATRLVSMLGVVGILVITSTGALVLGTQLVNMDVGFARIFEASLACGLLSLPFGGISVVLAAMTGRRGVGLGGGLGMAITMFVLYSLAPLVSFFEALLPANPFEWTIGQSPLVNGIDAGWTLLTISVSAVLSAVSFYFFQRRDIAG